MDTSKGHEDVPATTSATDKPSAATRPTTLNILLDNGIKSPLISSFRTPSLGDLQPLLRSEVEKFLQQWKPSPQTPGSFLNPKNVTEEQEKFANAFTQKLNELQESGCSASITAAISPATTGVGPNNLYNVNLSELNAQNLNNLAELCRQAAQQQPGLCTAPASIFLYSPTGFNARSLNNSQGNSSESPQAPTTFDNPSASVQNPLQGSVSITLPAAAVPAQSNELTTVQLPSGLRFEITTSGGIPRSSVLKMLGLEAPPSDIKQTVGSDSGQPTDSALWPLRIQTSTSGEPNQQDSSHSGLLTSPREGGDTRPPSVENSLDQSEISRPLRSSSSLSSNSSVSQSNVKDSVSCAGLKDVRLDPTEQSRMRLERKRARNRDAARKCRERKIRLIKSLEKDVLHLSEENKALRNRLTRSRAEIERLKLFVVDHLEKDCPAVSGKVV
ncbi:unnamed protein product [Calicophoron daubneyi]|uniref:BZIP domain-containing protein n=1 Tax=Calicophoron daubneyi TaxID=300641 RepID=A0AAV2TT28_CALDB